MAVVRRNVHNSNALRNKSNQYEYDLEILPYSKTRLILRPLAFTLAVSSGCFVAATIAQYETMRANLAQHYERGFSHVEKKLFKFRQQMNKWVNAMHPGEKTASVIIALNVGVFLLWRIPSLRITMTKWFTATPLSGLSSPMFLSCFSHIETWHLACNMIVLWSFSPVIHDMLGREQFLAFYISGGLCSAYISHLFKLITSSYVASHGASGCILGVLAAVCVANPDARLAILFLPFFSFPASKALIGLVSFDLAGLLFRWGLFDHAAHLGGVAFGSWYIMFGHKYLWDKRLVLTRKWHEFRQTFSR
ncbi:presenilins-associated rhomboid-like protein, mitochondrial isoform X2 [Dendronephthya gigantea]|uniref:presenilins-associated rhomboid-like protein, mitochondrial isoform X2 n=1 Tax=Dendronephthya gigantea TaxID=151771 RepID=UPI00106B5A90|nr:presenilins-associated rhomboid-like protein, mitochondrial isoform X2 [Dendronephthya gigantea]